MSSPRREFVDDEKVPDGRYDRDARLDGVCPRQGGLGGPVPTETPAEATPDFKVRPYRPVLNFLMRNRVPVHTISPVSAPQPIGPTRDEVARMVQDGGFSPAEITAAKVKLDEIQARSRQAAVKYLATVDCLYYPEAEASLIAALRADRNEAVRSEAATAIGGCRGVTVRSLDALHLTATAQETDGNPAEPSEARALGSAHLAEQAPLQRSIRGRRGLPAGHGKSSDANRRIHAARRPIFAGRESAGLTARARHRCHGQRSAQRAPRRRRFRHAQRSMIIGGTSFTGATPPLPLAPLIHVYAA